MSDKQKLPINGMLLLDKPLGMSSNKALQSVKKLLNALKAGHTGSLDPLATGVLPICLGKATKVSNFFLDADKRYTVTIKFGVTTDSGDSEGKVIDSKTVDFSRSQLEQALATFQGDIQQVPPMYSALKKNGQPLYKLARQGIIIERPARAVTVHQLDIIDFADDLLTLDLFCSKGFYVRSLAHDLGVSLGCGGHVTALRRTQVGMFTLDKCIRLDALAEIEEGQCRRNWVFDMDLGLMHLPQAKIMDKTVVNICQGQSVAVICSEQQGLNRIYSESGQFIGLGDVNQSRVAAKRILIE